MADKQEQTAQTAQEKLADFMKANNIVIANLLVVSPSGRSQVAIDEALQDTFRGWQFAYSAEYQKNGNG